jgi:4-amino-4-deoxy-L-arabinose transferase-like glycosyltransferase
MRPQQPAGSQAPARAPAARNAQQDAEDDSEAGRGRAPLQLTLTRRHTQVVLALIMAMALLLRVHDYTAAPRPRDNVDELAWAWAGLSLWQDHSPTSWSYLPAYPGTFPIREPDNGRVLPGVHHWLDHPPVFALIIGGFAWLAGERQFEQVTDGVIRLPVIALSLLTLLLAYLLGRRILGQLPALFGAALFGLAPGAVLGSREVESEALLAPLLLLALLILHRLLRDESRRYETALLMAICWMGPLVKVPGVAIGVIVVVVLPSRGRWALASMAAFATWLGLVVYVLYGFAVDWQQFLAVVQAQAGRHGGLLSGYEFIVSPAGFSDSVQLHDGWWLLGWLGLALLAVLRRPTRGDLLLAWPIAAFAVVVMLVADVNAAFRYGWYRFAIYPLVYLVAADFVVAAVLRPTLVRLAILLIIPAAAATLATNPAGGALNPPLLLEVAALVVLFGACIASRRVVASSEGWRRWWPQLAAGAMIALVLALNLVQSFRLAEIYTSL